MSQPKKLKWGLLAAGKIANKLAQAIRDSETGELYAVGSRNLESAQAFAKEWKMPQAYGSYDALIADPDVDVIYISTPHPFHAQWAIACARAGKHILCEKPATLNHAEALAVLDAVEQNNVFFMEAFMYRCNPQTAKITELIRDKVIGDVQLIEADFSFNSGVNPTSRLQANELGGGGILDVGCYTMSMSRLIAGAAQGLPFANPISIKGSAQLDEETGVDVYASTTLKFTGEILAQLTCGVRLAHDNQVTVFGTEGKMTITAPWFCNGEILIRRKGTKEDEVIRVDSPQNSYVYQVDLIAQHLADKETPAMSWQDTLGNMQCLDTWRKEIGLTYNSEKSGSPLPPVDGKPLAVKDNNMLYGEIDGLEKKVSRLIMGCDNQRTHPFANVMFDDYFERGGNCFDTAVVYRGMNRLPSYIGEWIERRGVREETVLIDKGAHKPFNWPQFIEPEMEVALNFHRTDYIDIYMMHRDNPEVPVGEFVDILDRMVKQGTTKIYGLSNWTLARLQEAVAYAGKNNLTPPTVVSNNMSLAHMVNPVWPGCESASSSEFKAWLTESQMPLLPWSSQARGFFTDRSGPDKLSDESLVQSWYSDDNFERKQRAISLAEKKSVLPINIALAYVLNQPFPTFPLFGPRTPAETRSSLVGLDVKLSREEVEWLNLDRDSI